MACLEWLFIGLWAAYLSVSSSVYGLWVDTLKACRAGKALPGFKYLVIWKKKKACYFDEFLLSWCLRILSWQRVPGTAACHASNHREPNCKITLCVSNNRELLQKRNSTEQGRGVCVWHRLCCLQGVCSKLMCWPVPGSRRHLGHSLFHLMKKIKPATWDFVVLCVSSNNFLRFSASETLHFIWKFEPAVLEYPA